MTNRQSDKALLSEAMRLLGDEWTLMITHVAYFGASRFDHFMAVLPISRPRLAERLKILVAVGIFEKRRYHDRPARYDYIYTDMGYAVHPVAVSLIDWANKWRPTTAKQLHDDAKHKPCGNPVRGKLICEACGDVILPGTLREVSSDFCQWRSTVDSVMSRWSKVKNSKLFEVAMDPAMRALKVVGDRWTPQILDRILSGYHRFDALQQELGVSRNILADRIAHMEDEGLIERKAYMTSPTRYDYLATDAARDLYAPLYLLRAWVKKWRLNNHKDASIIHLTCGKPTEPILVCASCDEPLREEDCLEPVKEMAKAAFAEGRINAQTNLWDHLLQLSSKADPST